jgi:hypothetical protein
MKRLIALGFALVLSPGLAGVVSAEDGRPWPTADPGVPTDPAFPEAILTGVPTDQAPGNPAPQGSPWWYLPPSGYEGGVESGAGLSGTYIGTSPHIYYIPAFQYQGLWSDPQGWWSCTAYSAAMAVDKATYGGSRITGRQIRALTGVGPDQGLTLPQVMRATDILAVPFVRPIGQWSAVMAALGQHRGVILQGDYDQIPDSINLSSFDGYHAVYLDRLHSDGVHIYMMDPLRRAGPVWVDASILRAFAEKLTRQEGAYPMVLFAYTRATRLFH